MCIVCAFPPAPLPLPLPKRPPSSSALPHALHASERQLSAALLLGSADIARAVGAAGRGELHACVISRLVAQGSSDCSELQWTAYCS